MIENSFSYRAELEGKSKKENTEVIDYLLTQ